MSGGAEKIFLLDVGRVSLDSYTRLAQGYKLIEFIANRRRIIFVGTVRDYAIEDPLASAVAKQRCRNLQANIFKVLLRKGVLVFGID